MMNKKQKTKMVLVVIALVAAIILAVYGVNYALLGYNPLQGTGAVAQTEAQEETENKDITVTVVEAEKPTPEIKEDNDSLGEDESMEKEKLEEAPVKEEKKELGLAVENGKLVDVDGNPVQLRGISTHDIAWYPEYINEKAFKTYANDWGLDVIRICMYTSEYNGYCVGDDENRAELKRLVDKGVQYATENDMYVVIDWHTLFDNNPLEYKEMAIQFFGEMVRKYKDNTNVIYEICNEPNGDTTWEDVKKYANQVIPVIRNVDPDAVIICGTPVWCQDLTSAVESPLEYDNVLYSAHFYAATHKDELRATVQSAIDAGLPVIISEFGLCAADGQGTIDTQSASEWMKLIEDNELSCIMWNLSNKDETCALISHECEKTAGWEFKDMSNHGQWMLNNIAKEK